MDDKGLVDLTGPPQTEDELREQAVTELRKRREFSGHLLAYITVNTFLVVIWYLSGVDFFWPAFPIFGWGIGLVFHASDVFSPAPSEASVRAAMDRIARRK